MRARIEDLFKRLDITPQNPELYKIALTHPSYKNEHALLSDNNQRLEFLGDAVIQLAITERIFHEKKRMHEGEMSLYRANLVRTETLAALAQRLELFQFMMLGEGEKKSGGRERPTILCDGFEAIFGAMYLDLGAAATQKCLYRLYDEMLQEVDEARFLQLKDNKTRLQELVQADTRKVLEYVAVQTAGTSNHPVFEVSVKMDGVVLGVGHGLRKKEAEQDAARDALSKMAK
jgi:ribonuclease-3